MNTNNLIDCRVADVPAHTFKRPAVQPVQECGVKRGGIVLEGDADVVAHALKHPVVQDDVQGHGKRFPLLPGAVTDSGTRHP